MEPIRTLVADDELVALRGVGRLLERAPDVRLIGEARTGAEAVEIIRAERPELLFLDIQMPDLDGLACMAALEPDERPVTVFVTAFDQYALPAFEVQAVDYLLKPFGDARFFAALDRAREQVLLRRMRAAAPPGGAAGPDGPDHLTRLLVRRGERMAFVDVAEIDWIRAADYAVEVHVGRESYALRESIGELERRLDPRRFVRVHRSAIVNLDRIREIQPYFNGRYILILRSGARVAVSRRRRAALEAAIGQKL